MLDSMFNGSDIRLVDISKFTQLVLDFWMGRRGVTYDFGLTKILLFH